MDRLANPSLTGMVLRPGSVRLAQLRAVYAQPIEVQIAPAAFADVQASCEAVQRTVARGSVAYGINTGFGKFAQTIVPPDRLAELQTNLVLSHSAGTGSLLSDDVVRLLMVLKAISLARGCSGVRPEVVHTLMRLVNAHVYPCIPEKGSVGASGDLAPLAHLAAAMIGVGDVRID